MLSLRAAARLLATSADDDPRPLLSSLGFALPPATLSPATRRALGVPPGTGAALVARGDGDLRALVVTVAKTHEPFRRGIARLAANLAARSPHLLWLLIAIEEHGLHSALAAWSGEHNPPRVTALVVDRTRIVDTDAETFCALAAARDGSDILTHARWLDTLARDTLSGRFYRTLEKLVARLADSLRAGVADSDTRRTLALLCTSRLLFLSFLEAKGWLDEDRAFLIRRFDDCMATGGRYYQRVLLPLFFGTLNTPIGHRAPATHRFGRVPFLNGGLFARTPLERRTAGATFPDDVLGDLHAQLLNRYRFTAREDSTAWSEVAIDPEMLGRAFESLMESAERRSSGAFYTPHALVDHLTSEALCHALATDGTPVDVVRAALLGQAPPPRQAADLRTRVRALRILDPACGSGAFLVHALERTASLAALLGDRRPTAELRRKVLTRSIFGVDVNPVAVWLCELRLWLCIVIENDERDPLRVPTLPNLDHHIVVGDALAGDDFAVTVPLPTPARIRELRTRYARASGARKRTLAHLLDRAEREHATRILDYQIAAAQAARGDRLRAARARDLFGARSHPSASERRDRTELKARLRSLRRQRHALRDGAALPFTFATRFADAAARGGFDVVLGNPPWVRTHRIPPERRAMLRHHFWVARHPGWENGAMSAGAGRGFANQIDLAAVFAERSLRLLRPGGVAALLLPAKLWRSLAGAGLRHLLADCILILEDWSDTSPAFDAAVYPSALVAQRAPAGGGELVRVGHRTRPGENESWTTERRRLPFDASPGAPWLLIPPAPRTGFDALTRAGLSLRSSPLERPLLGVKCGYNDAFLVVRSPGNGELVHVTSGVHEGCVERELLRPAVRGEAVSRWSVRDDECSIIWTHDLHGGPLALLPPGAAAWLSRFEERLSARTDARRRTRWWSLFRTDAACDSRPRVVWADIGRAPRAAVLPSGGRHIPLNTCYVVPCPDLTDAYALTSILNSPLAHGWLSAIAEPARGGYHRYLGWTMSLLPLPRSWERARERLAPIGQRATTGAPPTRDELLDATLDVYGLAPSEVAPLLNWSGA